MDAVAKGAAKSFGIGVALRLMLLVLLLLVARGERWEFAVPITVTIIVWIVADAVFLFLPNLVRHRKRWTKSDDYKAAITTESERIGPLAAIYSNLPDQFET